VASSENENRLSVKVNNLLNRKLGSEAASLLERGQKEFLELSIAFVVNPSQMLQFTFCESVRFAKA